MFFNRNKTGGVTWLVVGLGNPGSKYESTRHNMGFLAVDMLAEKENFKFNKLRFKAWTATCELGGEKVLVMKPQTYMNLSGESVGEAARFYKIPPEHVLVISDDIALPTGKLRIRSGGSAGGHNGLKNIIQHLGSDKFPELNKKIDEVAAKYGVTNTTIAVAWLLRHPANFQPIIGTMNIGRLKECFAA